VDRIFFLLLVTDEAENVLTRLAVDLTDLAEAVLSFFGDCLAAFSASSSAFALIYLRSQSRTPLRFLYAEQVNLVHGLDSVKSRMAMARAFPESS